MAPGFLGHIRSPACRAEDTGGVGKGSAGLSPKSHIESGARAKITRLRFVFIVCTRFF
jgi:hypothetical protein